eukprot:304117-Pyramimonas_sp.AAC.1
MHDPGVPGGPSLRRTQTERNGGSWRDPPFSTQRSKSQGGELSVSNASDRRPPHRRRRRRPPS